MDRYLTAQEIADAAVRLGLSCMPHTKRSVNRRAKAEGWDDMGPMVRQRSGSNGGGGMEYHISLLPEVMSAALIAEVDKDVITQNTAQRREVEIAKRTALETTDLTARQRDVMNARAAILTAIESVQIAEGRSRSQTVAMFVEGRDSGVDLQTIVLANDRRNGCAEISRRTVLRWFQFRDDGGIGALAPKATKQQAEIPQWFWDFLPFYARPQKPCITEALDDFLAETPGTNETVTYTKIRRLLGRLGNVERHKGREGSLTLKARRAYVTRSTADLLPTCVYTADGKTFDAEIAHPIHGRPFRPEVTSVVDVATRLCVGFSVGLAENAEGVVDALRFACEKHGIPAIFYVDRGSGFKNDRLDAELTGLMGRLGTTKLHSLPQNSQARGIIERFHGTVWNKLSRSYETYIGAPMDRQARQKAFKHTRKEIKEFGVSHTLPSWEDFLVACGKAVEAYNNTVHSSLPNRMTPAEYWQSHVERGFEPVTVTEAESADLFRPYVRRRVRRSQVEWLKNKYFALELEEYHGDDVLVGYDIHNADHVWVRAIEERDGEEVPGRLICIAKFAGNEERYIPLTKERKSMEGRAKARERRLLDRLDEVQDELNPRHVVEAQRTAPVPDVSPTRPEVLDAEFSVVGEAPSVAEARAKNTAPRFANDAELAAWAIENPDKVHVSQMELLRDCLNDPIDRQILIDFGVDISALKQALRDAA